MGPRSPALGRKLAVIARACAVLGFPLWLLSYVWIPVRALGRETDSVWTVVVAAEIGAMALGLAAVGAGLVALRVLSADSPERRKARHGVRLGLLVWAVVVLFNVIGLLWFG